MSIHSGQLKSGPWLLGASRHEADQDEVGDEDAYKQQVSGPTPSSGAAGYGAGNSTWSGGTDPHAPAMSNAVMPSSVPGSGGGSGASGGRGHGHEQTVTPQMGSGLQSAIDLAKGASGNPYDYGGAGNGRYDCSGFQSDIYNALTGKPLGVRQFSTTSNFPALGFQPGYDPNSTYNIGVNPAPGMSGHMVGELNGVNLESGGAADATQYGGQAAGVNDSQFSHQYHLPNSMIVSPSAAPAPKTGKRNWYIMADLGGMPAATPPASPASTSPPAGGQVNWGATPDTQIMGPAAPPGWHPGPTPTSIWEYSPPGGSSTPHPGGSGGRTTTPSSGPPSANLTEALTRAGIDPAMHPLISGFSATEGNNPSGAPTLGFTDSQAGSSLDQHAQALARQIQDRQSVAGPFPHGGTPQQQAGWMATVVGQNGVASDWQGNAQPARSDYVNNIVRSMPAPSAPSASTNTAPAVHSGQLKSGAWLLEASQHVSDHDDIYSDAADKPHRQTEGPSDEGGGTVLGSRDGDPLSDFLQYVVDSPDLVPDQDALDQYAQVSDLDIHDYDRISDFLQREQGHLTARRWYR